MSRKDPRLYLPAEGPAFEVGHDVLLSSGQAHYLGVVLRLCPEQKVRLFNGRDGEWRAKILGIKKQGAVVRLEECMCLQSGIAVMTLLFAPLKREATELVVRMGTELGVSCFQPVITARTNTHKLNMARLALIAQEAAEQCERLDVPEICVPVPLKQLLAKWPREQSMAVALERHRPGLAPAKARALLIGPEGGFTEEEVMRLKAHEAVRSFSLGSLVLRAETAVVAGLSQLGVMHRLG